MRNRTIGINVRVDEKEKKILKSKAKKSGLNLSAYLRNSGLNQIIIEIPDENYRKIYNEIIELKNEILTLNKEQIKYKISKIQNTFLNIYNAKKVGEEDGNN